MQLGKLEKVPLREVWKHEALNFTTWLAQDENLKLLSNEIGIDISLIQTEASVGKFSVDILAEEENTNRKIVIENQLESTDHDHLGKIVTYASGFDAEIIIWIVKDVRDEHKQAIDWLNENTNEKINFFAINIELWRIENSPLAPKFNIISKPNNWAKALKKSSSTISSNNTTDLKMLQLEFWTNLNEYIKNQNINLNTRTPRPQHWYDLSLGVGSKAHLSLVVHNREQYCSVEVYIPNLKDLYYLLEQNKNKIENETNLKFEWMELPEKQASRIRIKKFNFNLENTDKWDDYFKWMIQTIEIMKPIFFKYIKNSDI
jgi:hypothetical protein